MTTCTFPDGDCCLLAKAQQDVAGSALVDLTTLDAYRVYHSTGGWGDATCGAFRLQGPCGVPLHVIASAGCGWDHVSVSTEKRIPNWTEMGWVKRRFFRPDATVMELHVPDSDHISIHHNCLHLWRPHTADIPRPPGWMVGLKDRS